MYPQYYNHCLLSRWLLSLAHGCVDDCVSRLFVIFFSVWDSFGSKDVTWPVAIHWRCFLAFVVGVHLPAGDLFGVGLFGLVLPSLANAN
ncbi:hypothetical protein FKM82_024562 [Ascaphus truei]